MAVKRALNNSEKGDKRSQWRAVTDPVCILVRENVYGRLSLREENVRRRETVQTDRNRHTDIVTTVAAP